MSELIAAVQKQDIGSELVYLYEIEYAPGEWAYFCPQTAEDLSDVQFRDSESPYTIRTYVPVPMELEGISKEADGPVGRPILTVANVLSVFKDALGGLDYKDLVGSRIVRRVTLKKYLVGEDKDSTPPVEFPKEIFIIDRMSDRNVISVTFELAVPYDLQGVAFPGRQIIGGLCPWIYRGADPSLDEWEKRGGCDWDGGEVYLNKEDEYILPENEFSEYTGSSVADGLYYTTTTQNRLGLDGSISPETVNDYWQALTNNAGTPSDSNGNYRRVRAYNNYSSSTTYNAYDASAYNDYVLDNGVMWQVKAVSMPANNHPAAPQSGRYWKRGDQCGKRLRSCRRRFQAVVSNGIPSAVDTERQNPLPFGGFPASRQYR